MPARVLHVSDLHAGRHSAPDVEQALATLVAAAPTRCGRRHRRPDAPGTARAARAARRRSCAGSARRSSRSRGTTTSRTRSPRGSRRPWAEFERLWETTEPVHRTDSLCIVGLNSVRPWRHQSGRLRDPQLARRRARLRGRAGRRAAGRTPPPPADRRAVADAEAPGRPPQPRPRRARRRRRGADPLRAHPPGNGERAPRVRGLAAASAAWSSPSPPVSGSRGRVAAAKRGASSSTRPTTPRSGETYVWRDGEWGLTAARRFPRGTEPLGQLGGA